MGKKAWVEMNDPKAREFKEEYAMKSLSRYTDLLARHERVLEALSVAETALKKAKAESCTMYDCGACAAKEALDKIEELKK